MDILVRIKEKESGTRDARETHGVWVLRDSAEGAEATVLKQQMGPVPKSPHLCPRPCDPADDNAADKAYFPDLLMGAAV